MGAIVTFLQPFLEYLRPTKSPYLMIILTAVIVICFGLEHPPNGNQYKPEFFIPLYIIMIIVIPLSFFTPRVEKQVLPSTLESEYLMDASPSTAAEKTSDSAVLKDTLQNSKFENDLDSVFKFARAIGLASGMIMMYFYYADEKGWGIFRVVGYAMILAQMITFLGFIALRHLKGEDTSDLNIFQIALITVTLFSGATLCGLHWHLESKTPFYYCSALKIQSTKGFIESNSCDYQPKGDVRVVNIEGDFKPDFRQISFLVLALCWLVYELFWLQSLIKVFRRNALAHG